MLGLSGLLNYMEERPELFENVHIYGDPAYGLSSHIMSGYKGIDLSNQQMRFNKWMSRVRQSVEWDFMIMKTLWAFITFKYLSKIRMSPVTKIVKVAMFLTNCHCCYDEGNLISEYFGVDPPTLEEYLDTYNVV
ncbi:hypothetical protein AeMF1_010318 [Aphanomyces euteiches]|nr:hypothetical protein AeMF1_010318 [Aphanomyces euteiches]KAH9184914.1 hypothetical protein AeNC1_013109 [Aphanomyces euteiches]